MVHEWRDGSGAYRRFFADAGRGNAYYESATEVSSTLRSNLHTQIELIVTQKLTPPLGHGPDKVLPKQAEAWRSSLSLPAVSANLRACQARYQTAFAPQLKDQALHEKIDGHFAEALETAAQIKPTLADAVSDAVGYRQTERLRQKLSALKKLIAADLAWQLGLQLGFNSLDGD